MTNARRRMRTRARSRIRALPNPDIKKCAYIAAIVAAALMLAVGLSFDSAIAPALAWLAR